MFFSLDRRCCRLLDALLRYEDYVTIDVLSAQLGQTRRNTQYDVCKINDAFKLAGIPPIISRRNKGIKLLDEQKVWWEKFSNERSGKTHYVFTQEERVALVICKSLLSNEINTVDEMAELLKVSRNTIFLDMKVVKERLANYGIAFEYVSKYGYTVKGNGIKIRSVFLYYISSLFPLISDGILTYLSDPEVLDHKQRLHAIEKALDVDYPEKTIDKIAIMLQCLKRDIPLEIPPDDEGICDKKTYKIVSQYYPELRKEDKFYVSIQLLGARLQGGDNLPDERSGMFSKMAETLVEHFERLVGIEIENRELLVYNLSKHLNRSVYRYRYGLIDPYDLEEEMQTRPKELFELVKLAAAELSKDIGYPINDSEAALLTVHFGAHMRRNNVSIGKARALLVTKTPEEGMELREKVDDAFPMLYIVGVITPEKLDSFAEPFHLVLSTQLLKYDGFYAYISNRLDAADKKKVLEVYLRYRKLKNENIGEDLYKSIQGYIPKENRQKVQEVINAYFYTPLPNLLQLVDKGSVQCVESISNWRDAIAQAALPLLESGQIESSYVDSMITDIEVYGCSTYLGNGVYLAHTKSRGDVRRSGVAIMTMRKATQFRNGPRVRILIVVASTDQNEHFTVLKEAVKLCTDEARVQKMLSCGDEEELYHVVEEFARET